MTAEERADEVEIVMEEVGDPRDPSRYVNHEVTALHIADAIRAAVAEEREACAVEAENNRLGWHTELDGFAKLKGDAIAEAIRQRGNP